MGGGGIIIALLQVVAALLVIVPIGLMVTIRYRAKDILIDRNISNASTAEFEEALDITGTLMNAISYFIFSCCICARLFKGTNFLTAVRRHKDKEKPYQAFDDKNFNYDAKWYCLLIVIALTIVIFLAGVCIVSILRDYCYIQNKPWCKVNNKSIVAEKQRLIIFHGLMIFMVFLTGCIIRGIFVVITYTSIRMWNVDPELSNGSSAELTDIENKHFDLYNNYIEIGIRTEVHRDTFKEWFVIQYLTYFLKVTTVLIHIIKSNYREREDYWDLGQSSLLIVYDALAFLVPFFVATWLNNAHDEYYKKMVKEYYTCYKDNIDYIPGYISITDSTRTQVPTQEGKHLLQKNGNNSTGIQRCNQTRRNMSRVENFVESKKTYRKDYHKYYVEAINMREIIAKNSDFDFTPSFLNLDIPLQNPGYTLTILIALMAFVFNFTTTIP